MSIEVDFIASRPRANPQCRLFRSIIDVFTDPELTQPGDEKEALEVLELLLRGRVDLRLGQFAVQAFQLKGLAVYSHAVGHRSVCQEEPLFIAIIYEPWVMEPGAGLCTVGSGSTAQDRKAKGNLREGGISWCLIWLAISSRG